MPVFHHTDTTRLPWILAERQLAPTRGKVSADYSQPGFLWATINAAGDGSAASGHDRSRTLWRQGGSLRVRFILAANDFTPWAEMHPRYPQWTADKVARLERNGRRKGSDPATWMCRAEPLPAARWLGVETRAYISTTWRPFDFAAYIAQITVVGEEPVAEASGVASIKIDGRQFVSRRIVPDDEPTLYLTTSDRTI